MLIDFSVILYIFSKHRRIVKFQNNLNFIISFIVIFVLTAAFHANIYFPDENSNESKKTEKPWRVPNDQRIATWFAQSRGRSQKRTNQLQHRHFDVQSHSDFRLIKWVWKVGGWGDSAGKIAQFYTFGRSSVVSDASIVG